MRGISFRRYSRKSCIRKSISVFGRRQFSTENAYRVSASIFSRAHVSMVVRADCVPERCPAILGRCRFCAQHPFPSMMTATCLGSRVKRSEEHTSELQSRLHLVCRLLLEKKKKKKKQIRAYAVHKWQQRERRIVDC